MERRYDRSRRWRQLDHWSPPAMVAAQVEALGGVPPDAELLCWPR